MLIKARNDFLHRAIEIRIRVTLTLPENRERTKTPNIAESAVKKLTNLEMFKATSSTIGTTADTRKKMLFSDFDRNANIKNISATIYYSLALFDSQARQCCSQLH